VLALTPGTKLIRDDRKINTVEMVEAAGRLEQEILSGKAHRMAVASPTVDVVVAALLACEKADCQCVLLRHEIDIESGVLAEWGVDAFVTSSGAVEIVRSGTTDSAASGFSVLLTTSGTTGKPKLAEHSLAKLLGRIRKPKPDSSPPTWLMTYHPASFAGMQVILSWLHGGGTLVAVSEAAVVDLCHAAVRYGVTHISGTPTFFRAFLVSAGRELTSLRLKQLTLGGEIADQAILSRLKQLWPQAGLTHIYASTEAGALFAVRDGRAGFPTAWLQTGVDGVKLRVRDGMLEVQSPRAMNRYISSKSSSADLVDGWLLTNDLVEVSEDRVLFMGRADSIINVGGAKVSPEEVEAVLLQHAGVAEVVVFGLPNSFTGAIVAADVRPAQSSNAETLRADLLKHARERLEPHKIPRIINVTDAINISAVGKKSRRI
jgi:acyl-coenzyme A synthetase/AMP-(fatty) acid ligase